MKKIIKYVSSLLAVIMVLASSISYASVTNNLQINAVNSAGIPLNNGHVEVYSFSNKKIIKTLELDAFGKGTIDTSRFKTNDVMIVVMKNGELSTFSVPNQNANLLKAMSNSNQINVKTEPVKTKKVAENKSSNITASAVATNGVVKSANLGSKMIKFASIQSTKGCKVQASLTNGSEIEVTGTGILSFKAVTGSSLSAESALRNSTQGEIVYYYTYFNLVEELHRYQHGGQVYEFYRLRPTKWNGGVVTSINYSSANSVSYSSISNKVTGTWEKGSTATLNNYSSSSFGAGWAGSFSGPLSGNSYGLDVSMKSSSSTVLKRIHAANTCYEYGNGISLISKNVVSK